MSGSAKGMLVIAWNLGFIGACFMGAALWPHPPLLFVFGFVMVWTAVVFLVAAAKL